MSTTHPLGLLATREAMSSLRVTVPVGVLGVQTQIGRASGGARGWAWRAGECSFRRGALTARALVTRGARWGAWYPGAAVTRGRLGDVKARTARCRGSLEPAHARTWEGRRPSAAASA